MILNSWVSNLMLSCKPFTFAPAEEVFQDVAYVFIHISLTPSSLAVTCLLITFANSLDPGQAQLNVGPVLDPNCLVLIVFLKDFLEKVVFEKNHHPTKKA